MYEVAAPPCLISAPKVEVLTPMAPSQSVPIDPAQDATGESDQPNAERSVSFLEASQNLAVSSDFIRFYQILSDVIRFPMKNTLRLPLRARVFFPDHSRTCSRWPSTPG